MKILTRRYWRDVLLHFTTALVCVLLGRHRDLALVGEIGRKGFRARPLYQCRKCLSFYIRDEDEKRLGGRPTCRCTNFRPAPSAADTQATTPAKGE